MHEIEQDIIDYIYEIIQKAAPYIQEITKDRREITYIYTDIKEARLTLVPLKKSPAYKIYEFLNTPDVKNQIVELDYSAMESFLKENIHYGVFIAYIKDSKKEVCFVPYHFFLYPLDEAIAKYKESVELEQKECIEQFKKEQQSEEKSFKDCKKELRYSEYLRLKKKFEGKEIK